MHNINTILESNAVRLILTFLAGMSTYFTVYALNWVISTNKLFKIGPNEFKKGLHIIIWVISIIPCGIILFSFLFDLGETYQYSQWYKRSFGPFGDGFPFALIMILNFGFYTKSRFLIVISMATIFLTGGKLVILASGLTIVFLHLISGERFNKNHSYTYLVISLLVYLYALVISNHVNIDVKKHVGNIYSEAYDIIKAGGGGDAYG